MQALSGGSLQLALSCAVFATVFTMIYFMSAATRAISGFVAGDGNMEITWRLFATVAILALTASGLTLSVAGIFWILSAGVVLAFGFCINAILRSAPNETLHSKAKTDVPVWRQKSIRISLASIVANVSLHIDVLVIGIFVDPLLAGAYFVAMRVANIFKRLTAAFGSYASRRIAPLYFSGNHAKLGGSLRELSLVALALVGGGLLFLTITAKWLLILFGAPYASEVSTLLVLAIGAGITTLAGPAPELLLHTGHESRYLSLITIGLVLRCAFLIALTPVYGTLGAATASTAGAMIVALLLNSACKRAVGIDPSIASLFHQHKVKPESGV
ncbi:MAG: polysaccharide biosynthesis C-terminal domain-containing protein [Hyphomicrobiales bacterium]